MRGVSRSLQNWTSRNLASRLAFITYSELEASTVLFGTVFIYSFSTLLISFLREASSLTLRLAGIDSLFLTLSYSSLSCSSLFLSLDFASGSLPGIGFILSRLLRAEVTFINCRVGHWLCLP